MVKTYRRIEDTVNQYICLC